MVGNERFEMLAKILERYEMPFDMVDMLMELERFDSLHFVVVDSDSMTRNSDARDHNGRLMSRLEEARHRLKTMMAIAAFIPVREIVLCFLNHCDVIDIDHRPGRNPDEIVGPIYEKIDQLFHHLFSSDQSRGPKDESSSMFQTVRKSLQVPGSIARYFFSDGVPNDGSRDIKKLIMERPNTEDNPVTFLSCTDKDEDVEWMKEIEEVAEYCAEYDDYEDEAREVLGDQGDAIPYTEGFHLIGQLVGAMNPEDLDALDEAVPLTYESFNNIMGGYYSQTFSYYFNHFLRAQNLISNSFLISNCLVFMAIISDLNIHNNKTVLINKFNIGPVRFVSSTLLGTIC
jgi:hypothetical protein